MPSTPSVLLIHPPVSKPGEPPAGLARLAGVLGAHGIDCRLWDASLEGILAVLARPPAGDDTWSRRARAHVGEHLERLRSPSLFANPDGAKRAVMDIHRLLQLAGRAAGVRMSLSDFSSPALSPLRSRDLLRAAEEHAENPFAAVWREELDRRLRHWEPNVVGISVNYLSQALCAFALAGRIRSRFPGKRIVMGGGLITSWMGIPGFDNPFSGLVDDLVSGPGEAALLRLCGIEPRPPAVGAGMDFSGLPLTDYLSPGTVLPYAASRGCYWRRCAFCPETTENSPYRPLAPAQVGAEIHRLKTTVDPVLVHFLDNAMSPRLLRHLMENPPGVPWYGFARITSHLTDADFVRGLHAAGCVMLKLGIESGDPAVLERLGKGIRPETVSRALKALHAAGIATYAYLLFGTPAETEAGARKTFDFTLAHSEFIDFLNLAIFNLPAHSPEARRLATVDFYAADLSLYREFVHPGGWHRRRVRHFLDRVFRQPPAIRSILQRDPPFFTSNHAPFVAMARRGHRA